MLYVYLRVGFFDDSVMFCDLWFVICDLRFVLCALRFAICDLCIAFGGFFRLNIKVK